MSDLTGAEGDDAADGVVRGDADSDPIAGNDLDSKTAHPSAELREHFVSGVAFHAVQPTGVNRDDGSLHVNQIVFAQPFVLSLPAIRDRPWAPIVAKPIAGPLAAMSAESVDSLGRLHGGPALRAPEVCRLTGADVLGSRLEAPVS